MKKIAFVIRLFQCENFYGGGEKYLNKLIEQFISHGYIVDVWCHETNLNDYPGIHKIFKYDNYIESINPVASESFQSELVKTMAKENYDFVISDGIKPKHDRLLLQVFSSQYQKSLIEKITKNLFDKFFNNKKLIARSYDKKWLQQDHKTIFVVSHKVKEDLIKNFNVDENKIKIIYPGIDPSEQINIEEKEKNDIFTFGMSATFFKRKGGILFLKALRILKKKNIKFKARIILRSKKASKIKRLNLLLKLFNISNEVEFIAHQNKMQDFYKQIDCLVMPSIEEAFGMVALEAMLNKIPSIITSTSGVSEIVQDGYDSFVFTMDKNASTNLANKMIEVINNPQKVSICIENAYKTALNHTWKETFTSIDNELSSNESK